MTGGEWKVLNLLQLSARRFGHFNKTSVSNIKIFGAMVYAEGRDEFTPIASALIYEACRVTAFEKTWRLEDRGYCLYLVGGEKEITASYDETDPFDRVRAALECLLAIPEVEK